MKNLFKPVTGNLIACCFLAFALQASINANNASGDDILTRTAEMVRALENMERHDTRLPGYEALISEIFSGRRYDQTAVLLITDFLLSTGNHSGRRFMFNQLAKTGTPGSHQYMAEMLAFENTAYLALMTLQDIPGPGISRLLRKSYPSAHRSVKAGIINALGARRDERSVRFISGFTGDKDKRLSRSAIYALGRTGTRRAVRVLEKELKPAPRPQQILIMEALLEAAEQLNSDLKPGPANRIYSSVLESNPPETIALAAVRGILATTDGNPAEILAGHIAAASGDLRRGLIDLARHLPVSFDRGIELLEIPGLRDEEKIRLMMVLAARNDRSIHGPALSFLDHDIPAVREQAVRVLSMIAVTDDAPLLAGLAADRSGREQELAREGLYRIGEAGTDSLVLLKAASMDDGLAAEYVRAIGERNIPSSAGVLLAAAGSSHQEVRIESYRALARTAETVDTGPVIELLFGAGNARERQELERALFMIATREGPGKANTSRIVQYLDKTTEPDRKVLLISLLGTIKNPGDLGKLLACLESEDPDIMLSAVRALSDWPDAGPAEKFRSIIEETEDIRIRTLTLRGYTQVIVNDNDLPYGEKASLLDFGLQHAPNVAEQRTVVSALGRTPSLSSLRILINHIVSDDLRSEIEAAMVNILPALINSYPENTREELRRVTGLTENNEILKWLN